MKLKRLKLMEIRNALQNIAASKPAESPWEIVRNIKTASRILDEQDELHRKYYEECIDKDASGNPVKYTEKDTQGRDTETVKITDAEAESRYRLFVKNMNEEEHEVEFKKIPMTAFKKQIEKEKLDLNLLVPLLGVIIPEEDGKE